MAVKDKYIYGYAADMHAAKRFDQIQKTVADEVARQIELEKLIADEADTLAKLEETLRVKVNPLDASSRLLSDLYASDISAARVFAQQKDVERRQAAAPENVKQALATRDRLQRETNTRAALDKMLAAPGSYTRAQFDAAVREATQAGINIGNKAIAGQDKTWKAPTKPSGKAAEQSRAIQGALEAVVLGSEVGFVGGFEGEAAANSRASAPAPEGSAFTTEADAFNKYIEALEDGDPSDLAQNVSAEDFAFAQRIYRDAKALGAYQRRQAKYFEPAWIEQAKRLTDTKAQAQAARERMGGRTPEQEAARRELIARGLDPDDKYLEYKGTADYDYFTNADQIYDSLAGQPIKAITVPQRRVKALLDQYAAYDKEWDVKKLEKELKKFVPEKDIASAIGWGLAYDRIKEEGQKTPSQLELQKEFERKEKEAAEQAVAELDADVAKAQKDLNKVAAATTSMTPTPEQAAAAQAPERQGVYVPLDALTEKLTEIEAKIKKPAVVRTPETIDPRTGERAIFVPRAAYQEFYNQMNSDDPAVLEKAVERLSIEPPVEITPPVTRKEARQTQRAEQRIGRLQDRYAQLGAEFDESEANKFRQKRGEVDASQKSLIRALGRTAVKLDELGAPRTPPPVETPTVTPRVLEPVPSRLRDVRPAGQPPAAPGLYTGTERTAPTPTPPPPPPVDPRVAVAKRIKDMLADTTKYPKNSEARNQLLDELDRLEGR